MAHVTRALRHRNYRLFFSGQTLSLVGTWITRVATSWLVYRLTGSELLLGAWSVLRPDSHAAPRAVRGRARRPLEPASPAGRDADRCRCSSRWRSRVLTLDGLDHGAWHILVLQVGQGVINAFDTPARQAFVVEMVEDRADLPNAIALNSSMVNGSRIIGPSIGGALIAAVGEGWCFIVDAVSYVFVIALAAAMRSRPVAAEATRDAAARRARGWLSIRPAARSRSARPSSCWRSSARWRCPTRC